MARYWVGGTGSWSNTAHWSDTSGGATGFSVPSTTDDVVFDSASHTGAYTVTIDTTASCRDFTVSAPATGNATLAGSAALSVYGSFTLYTGLIRTYTGAITFAATTTGKTITTAGTTLASAFTFNGVGGGWTLGSALTTSSIEVTKGAFNSGSYNITLSGTITSTGTSTASITLGTSTVVATGSTLRLASTGLTVSAASSTLTAASGGNFYLYDHNFGTVDITGGWFQGYSGVSCTGTLGTLIFRSANQYGGVTVYSNITTTSFQLLGTSPSVCVLLGTDNAGYNLLTQRTITASSVTAQYAVINNIVAAGAASWDFSASNTVSDGGNNSGITFPTPITAYWVGNTGLWSNTSMWASTSGGSGGTARVPLIQDTARFDANSFTSSGRVVTADVRLLGSVNFTGATNTPTLSQNMSYGAFSGSVTLISAMIFNHDALFTRGSAGTHTFTSGGYVFSGPVSFSCPVGSYYILQDALTTSGQCSLDGVDTNGYSITAANYYYSGYTCYLRSSVLTATGATSPIFNFIYYASGYANFGTATLRASGTLTTGTYTHYFYYPPHVGTPSIVINTSGAYDNYILGNTGVFDTFSINTTSAARSLKVYAGTSLNVASFVKTGNNQLTIGVHSGSTSFKMNKTGGGTVVVSNAVISSSNVAPTNTWYAFDSTNSGNNNGWIFAVSVSGTDTITPSETAKFAQDLKGTSTITASETGTLINYKLVSGTDSISGDDYATLQDFSTISGTDTATIADNAIVKNIWYFTAADSVTVTDSGTVIDYSAISGTDLNEIIMTAIITDPKYAPIYNDNATHHRTSFRLRQIVPNFIEADYV